MIAIVLMALAAISFGLRLFKVDIEDVDLIALGLLFMATSFLASSYWGPYRRTGP
jgi:hypothetical protein